MKTAHWLAGIAVTLGLIAYFNWLNGRDERAINAYIKACAEADPTTFVEIGCPGIILRDDR